uniref:Putative RNA-directed DNA methylation 4 isoform X2 n=1 Tax=Davidia involucrata TaxID=16924 RepID=A0A5B6ZP96_DAVIN
MADVAESSSIPSKNEKPVIVRVKRKAFQSLLEAFWLEINERPLKRPLLDFEKLSISESSRKEELKTKKVFVRHVETVSSSEVTIDTLRSFVPNSADTFECEVKHKEQRRTFKTQNKQDHLLVKAKQQQEVLSKNARFEQIWKSRKGKEEAMHDETVHEMCHLYDVVRVDVEETTKVVQEREETELEDHRIMSSYLPLLREFIPSAASEIESDIHDYVSKQASKDDYVYDFYAVKDDISITEEDTSIPFPLVQVDDDDGFYDGLVESEFESDDSNAEDNPVNDYPDQETSDQETSEDEEEVESRTSNDESELDRASPSNKSPEHEDLAQQDWSEDSELLYEDEIYSEDDGDDWR